MDEYQSSGQSEEDLLRSAQSILFARERERIRALEEEVAAYRQKEATIESLQQQIEYLEAKLKEVERGYEDQVMDLQTNISILNYKNFGRSESLLSRLSPVFSRLIGRRIEEDRDEMAQAFSPIMGEAIRTQIRNSRQDMIDAIYPIIGESVQKSVTETLREIQRNIDSRLRHTSGDIWHVITARLRGVSSSELTLRNAIPFSIQQVFLIQHGTGLLMANHATEDTELSSGLIGGMLTAIREFARESFGRGRTDTDLDEIQYGNERIILQSGQYAYLAVVIRGIEPSGFHALLRQFISELHIEYDRALRLYDGDPDTITPLQPKLEKFVTSITAELGGPRPLSRAQRTIIFLGGLGIISFLALSCFYLQFTIALLPVAFPGPTHTPTATVPATSTLMPVPTNTAVPPSPPTITTTPSATYTPTNTATPSNTPTQTYTPTPSPTPTQTATPTMTYTPSPTPTPVSALMNGHVYVLSQPQLFTPRTGLVLKGTAVKILAVYDLWAKIEWSDQGANNQGWVLLQWIDLREPVPVYRITPTATREY